MQSEEVQALEDQNNRDMMALQTEADSARARAAAAESAAAASAAKVASLTQELAAAEAALTAARQEGEEALAAAQAQYESDLQHEQQKLREAKGAVRRQEEEWHHKIAALEVSQDCPASICMQIWVHLAATVRHAVTFKTVAHWITASRDYVHQRVFGSRALGISTAVHIPSSCMCYPVVCAGGD